ENIQLDEIEAASQMIYDEAHPDANIIWGAAFDPNLEDEMRVTIIATGFDQVKSVNIAETKAAASAETTQVKAPEKNDVAPVAEEAEATLEEENEEISAPETVVSQPAPTEPANPAFVTKIPSRKTADDDINAYKDMFECIKRIK
ncbi:MAG: hypothetical protein J6Q68_00340, partial [Clostridia bacterium]|nr:hypothetical protein [Clostridia bacterium]